MTIEDEREGEFEVWLAERQKGIGERLRSERRRLGLSAAEFASQTGIHRNSVRNYETGERVPDGLFWRAAKKTGVNVAYVLGEDVADVEGAPVFARDAGRLFFELLARRLPIRPEALTLALWAFLEDAKDGLAGSGDVMRLSDQNRLVDAALEDGERFEEAFSAAMGQKSSKSFAALIRDMLARFDAGK